MATAATAAGVAGSYSLDRCRFGPESRTVPFLLDAAVLDVADVAVRLCVLGTQRMLRSR